MGCMSSPKVKNQSTLTYDQNVFAGQGLRQAFQGIQGGVDPYTGQRVAGASPLQQQQFAGAGQYGPQGMAALGNIAGGQAPLDAMQNYGQRYAQDVITPNVMENFAGIGAADSGGAMKGLARELGNYGLGLNSQIGQASLQNQGQQLQAGGLLAGEMGQAGGMQRDITNQGLGAQQSQWSEGQDWNNPWRNVGNSLMGNATTPVQQAGGMGNEMLTSGLGALGAFTAIAGNPITALLGML